MTHMGHRSRTEGITQAFIPRSIKNVLGPGVTLKKNHVKYIRGDMFECTTPSLPTKDLST